MDLKIQLLLYYTKEQVIKFLLHCLIHIRIERNAEKSWNEIGCLYLPMRLVNFSEWLINI